MPPTVYALVLFSAALHATWNLLVKRATDKLLMTAAVTMSAGFAGALAMPFFPAPAPASWPFIAASGLASTGYFLMVAATYRLADMSLAYPVMRGSAPLIVGLAGVVMFAEYLPLSAWIAIGIISAGILSMALARHEHGRAGIGHALATAVVIAACTLIDAEGARRSQSPAAYTLWIFAVTGIWLGAWALVARRADLPKFVKAHWRGSLAAGVGALFSYGTALWAMTMAPVATVAALRETTVLFGAALAWLVLKERISRPRLVAILAIAVGAAVLRLT